MCHLLIKPTQPKAKALDPACKPTLTPSPAPSVAEVQLRGILQTDARTHTGRIAEAVGVRPC
jgi:hypothetical protein